MKKYQLLLLSALTGVLFFMGWFPAGKIFVLFFAFVPLLMVEDYFHTNSLAPKSRFLFLCSYISFFLWNLLTVWWIKNASLPGGIMAIVLNALFMAIVFQIFHRLKKRIGRAWGHVLFMCCWLAFEFIHINWELSFPWLTLGNAFADSTSMVQWYEYTGVLGGSAWILFVNVLIFELVSIPNLDLKTINKKSIGIILLSFFLPVFISSMIGVSGKYWVVKGGIKVAIVQPNIDPYNEKFYGNFQPQVKKMIKLAESKVDSTTDYLILPETALIEDMWEEQLDQSVSIIEFQNLIKKFPKLKIVIGASTTKAFKEGETPSATARKFSNAEAYYDSYNTALQLDSTGKIQIYHKSKLVIGVEKMPFPALMKPLEKLALDLGGTVGSLGVQENRVAFTSGIDSIKVAPVICYESIYGEYVNDYIKAGASFIAIITNDGWWGDTPGYKQHLKYGALRAIETRKWIVRSANTGISAFISPNGEIILPTQWWKPTAINMMIQPNTKITFYVKYGDYIGRAALCIVIAMLIYSLLLRFGIAKK